MVRTDTPKSSAAWAADNPSSTMTLSQSRYLSRPSLLRGLQTLPGLCIPVAVGLSGISAGRSWWSTVPQFMQSR